MKKISIIVATLILIFACKQHQTTKKNVTEDISSKEMLQGIWINEDGEDVVFKAKGDTIYYPDTTSIPVYFQIIDDTLHLHGAKETKYHILKQSNNLFAFENQSGERITLIKSDDTSNNYYFCAHKTTALNQCKLIKRDSILKIANTQYHYYVQVNPTTYKVVKTTYNDEGVGLENIYYDNIVHLSIYKGRECLYSSNFRKNDFDGLVPNDYLSQCILSDITYYKATLNDIIFIASLGIPDGSTSYQVNIFISTEGKKRMQVSD